MDIAVDPNRFDFKGYFFHDSVDSNAPNPCINIEGCGPLSIPLDEKDVPPLLSTMHDAKPALESKKMQQINVEFSPAQVVFSNPLWDHYLTSTHSVVCKRLGVKADETKMNFSKLTLCGKQATDGR